MSAAMTRRFVASVSVERTCACGATFQRNTTSRADLCPACTQERAEQTRDRARERRAERNRLAAAAKAAQAVAGVSLKCDDCGIALRVAAKWCNWCDPAFDRDAEMATLAEMAENASVAA